MDQAAIDELVDELVTESLDVHRPAGREVQHRFLALRGTVQATGAARHGLSLGLDDVRAANRAGGRQRGADRAVGAPFGQDAHDLGDHVARPPHVDGVADVHVLALDLVHVVQRGVTHGHAAHEHGLQARDGRHRPGAADLELDRLDDGQLFLGGKLVRNRPARGAGDESERALQVEGVDLVDHAVDVVLEGLAPRTDAPVVVQAARSPVDGLELRRDPKPPAGESPHRPAMGRREVTACHLADAVADHGEGALRSDARVELPEAARRGVARVGEGLLAAVAGAGVELGEALPGHVHLAADLEHRRPALADQAQRDRRDRADVLRHVLAAVAVAARGRLHQQAVLVTQADREAIELRLRGIGDLALDPRALAHAPVELGQVLLREGVVQREHREAVDHLRERRQRRGADPLRRRVGRHQRRVLGLERPELRHQPVVLAVGDLRVVEDVVAVVVEADELAQRLRARLRLPRGAHRSLRASWS